MSQSTSEGTGVLILNEVTPVIRAIFGAFKLDPDYPGGPKGEQKKCYIAEHAAESSVTNEDMFEAIRELAIRLCNIKNPDSVLMRDIAQALADHFKLSDADRNSLADIIQGEDEDNSSVEFDQALELAQLLDDGHGLSAIHWEGCWHSSRPLLFNSGGSGQYISKEFQITTSSSDAAKVGQTMQAAIGEGNIDLAAATIRSRVNVLLSCVQDESVREAISGKLDGGKAPTSAPRSLEEAQALAVAMLLPFLSKGEDGDTPANVLTKTLEELLPRYDATRARFLTPDQRDVLIRTIVDQKKRWDDNEVGEEIAEMVIHGYWGYCDATDGTLLDRAFGEVASIIDMNPELYTEADLELVDQLLALPQTMEYLANHESSFRDDIQNVLESIRGSLKARKKPRG